LTGKRRFFIVSRNILDRIIDAVHLVPTGADSRSTGIVVIDDQEMLKNMSDHFFSLYGTLEKALV